MTLTPGERVSGGDFLDLRELAAAAPVVCVFRVTEYCPAEMGNFGQYTPVVADVLVVDGPRAGEVHMGERFIGSITAALRGVPNANAQRRVPVSPPKYQVGVELILRVKVLNPGRDNASAVGDPPSEADKAAATAAHANGRCWTAAAPAPAVNGAATASTGKKQRPWD